MKTSINNKYNFVVLTSGLCAVCKEMGSVSELEYTPRKTFLDFLFSKPKQGGYRYKKSGVVVLQGNSHGL